jgi:hypothetical protein
MRSMVEGADWRSPLRLAALDTSPAGGGGTKNYSSAARKRSARRAKKLTPIGSALSLKS